jgi:hypothetical protein
MSLRKAVDMMPQSRQYAAFQHSPGHFLQTNMTEGVPTSQVCLETNNDMFGVLLSQKSDNSIAVRSEKNGGIRPCQGAFIITCYRLDSPPFAKN